MATDPSPDAEPVPDAPEEDVADPETVAARGQVQEPVEDEYAGQVTDELLPEERLTEFEPPDAASEPSASGHTAEDERDRETVDERLAQEQRDVDTISPE